MRIFTSKPMLRWLAPVAFVAVIAAGGLVAASADAQKKLPTMTAEELLVAVQTAKLSGLSGTVVQRSDLGIPSIPGAGGADSADLTSLVSGTHTLRVRYSAPDKARLAVFGTFGETDLIADGRDVWTWSSHDNTATHRKLAAGQKPDAGGRPLDAPTPQQAADKVLAALTPTTTVTTDSAVTVAKRPAYELVLQPNDDQSLIKQVRIAVDSDTKLPLRVQVLVAGGRVAFEVAYSSVSFTRPDDAEFAFNPPPGAKVTEEPNAEPGQPGKNGKPTAGGQDKAGGNKPTLVGKGWTTVAVTKAGGANESGNRQLDGFLNKLPRVSGSWGSGRVLAGTAFSAVVTDDGRIAVGAVTPEVLYRALG